MLFRSCRHSAGANALALPEFDAFWKEGYLEIPAARDEYVLFGDFRAEPSKHPLRTPSGRIELYSERIAGFGYDDCPPHATWIEPSEWVGGDIAASYPLHLVSSQPRDRLHSQMDCGPVSAGGKVAGREAISMHPADAAARGIRDGDVVRVHNARALAQRYERAQAAAMSVRGDYTLILATANDANMLAATPGQHTPILALAAHDERQPDGADGILRWPATPDALYSAITNVTGAETSQRDAAETDTALDASVDAKTIADLEKSLGFKTLLDILQSYLHTAEDLATSLTTATEAEDWPQAGRLAQDFAGAAGGLGLTAIAAAARTLALGARDGANEALLSTAACNVLAEHGRVREALHRLYPDLSA